MTQERGKNCKTLNDGKIFEQKQKEDGNMVEKWMLEIIKDWSVQKIRNNIWMAVDHGQPIPGCVTVEALRYELMQRGEEPIGYHNT